MKTSYLLSMKRLAFLWQLIEVAVAMRIYSSKQELGELPSYILSRNHLHPSLTEVYLSFIRRHYFGQWAP
jgi:hypothetical protein